MTNQLSDQPAGLIVGQDFIPLALAAFHRIAQQHTRQAKPPGVLAGRRKLERLNVVIINAPAYPGLVNPLTKVTQPLFIDIETCGQDWDIQ